jgi:cyclophilin family peptidyl-prolyl cis-trans isomerase
MKLAFATLILGGLLNSAAALADSATDTVKIRMNTNKGSIELTLDHGKAPVSVDNFLTYIDSHHYDNTLFHRVISGFMIQGGGYSTDMRQKATLPPIKNEAQNGLRNLRGTIAMARMSDPDSASSQFFINLADNRFLDHGTRDFGYAVFGEVTAGMDVVDAIAAVKTLPGDQPAEPVILQNIEVIQEATTTSVAK